MFGVKYDLQSRSELVLTDNWVHTNYDSDNRSELLRHLGSFWVAHLDAESRFRLASPTECYDVRRESPGNALQAFFAGGKPFLDELRKAFAMRLRLISRSIGRPCVSGSLQIYRSFFPQFLSGCFQPKRLRSRYPSYFAIVDCAVANFPMLRSTSRGTCSMVSSIKRSTTAFKSFVSL
jgi:hypothetical protein